MSSESSQGSPNQPIGRSPGEAPGLLAEAPELLAPAGDWDCVHAAIENGADAIYFGLHSGFNARARAKNFAPDELPELMRLLHRRGVRGYVTFNTLVFPGELAQAAKTLRWIAAAGVDAVLVQDLGVARLARATCPQLEVHASTQMTLTSAEGINVAKELGISRAVVARELSIAEIREITSKTEIPVEVFVHGALCVAYSGQCLTSESLGGRSANRGQCAQACRLPYDLIVDDVERDLGDVKYLLSPQDLAAYPLVDQLIDAGVCSLKIEGRLKTAEYVANITQHYRSVIDDVMAGRKVRVSAQQTREMELSFSRGFSPGWLEGCDHKMLVPGDYSAKRGVLLGEVVGVAGGRVTIELACPIARGDGIAFQGNRLDGTELGGRVFELYRRGKKVDAKEVVDGVVEVVLGPGRFPTEDLYVGQTVWKNDDPQLNKRLRESFSGPDPKRRMPLDLDIEAEVGKPLRVIAQTSRGHCLVLNSPAPLEAARQHPLTEESLRQQFERLGGTPFELRHLQAKISGGPILPHSIAGALRKSLVEGLIERCEQVEHREICDTSLEKLLVDAKESALPLEPETDSGLIVLVRTPEQLLTALEAGVAQVYVDYHDIREYRSAVEVVRKSEAKIFLSPLRIQKPGELGLTKKLLKLEPDGLLVRNLASLQLCIEQGVTAIADFSLNIANPLTADWLRRFGVMRLTTSYDLNRDQLRELIQAAPSRDWEVVIHQHMPMFHMEHCVFCSVLSPGTNKTNCGRPCDHHQVRLRDRIGMEHPLQADIGCRNTLYNAVPQSAAEVVPELQQLGVRYFRIELLEEDARQTKRVIDLYQKLLAGVVEPAGVWRQLQASNRVGVTRGTLEERRNPLAIL